MGGSERSPLYDKTTSWQRVAGFSALGCVAVALLFLVEMMKGKNTDQGFLGGLNFKDMIFNYHPIFMTTGLILFSFSAILSYRLLPLPKSTTKPLHGFFHFCAICFVIMGLTCVLVGNNYPDYNWTHGYLSNFSSLHSYIGLGAICVFVQNYFFGFCHFLLPESWISIEQRKKYMPMHVFFGFLAVILSVLAMETGLMELLGELTANHICEYTVNSADTNPASNYHKLPAGCKHGNAAGIFVLASVALFFFATYDFRKWIPQRASSQEETLLKRDSHLVYHT